MSVAFSAGSGSFGGSRLRKNLLKHFGVPAGRIATAGRQFPSTSRPDIQSAVEELMRNRAGTKLFGIVSPKMHEPPDLAQMLAGSHFPMDAGPLGARRDRYRRAGSRTLS